MFNFNTEEFISLHITGRPVSLFFEDIQNHKEQLNESIKDKNVLVIGGAGTIGSSFIKAILPFHPAQLVVVDYSENELTELTRDLRSHFNEYIPKEFITYPFDFGGPIFKKMFLQNRFNVVACFAAHKHVRSEKDHLAIEAMIRNNVFNTKQLLDLACQNKPEHFFSVSTDKAANPVNVMGASKKVMEKVLLAYSDQLKITTARFANVAFSNGSLLYGFIQRMMKRQPLSAPSDVKRYFVSPQESGQLCMLACLLGNSADIFFPKLDETQMLTFSHIAEQFLISLGLTPDYCKIEEEARLKAKAWTPDNKHYPVYFFETDTSGEKQFEEFFTLDDQVDVHSFKALGVVQNVEITPLTNIENMLSRFTELFDKNQIHKSDIIDLIHKYIPDFHHIETGRGLDEKM